jgi:hypothetical protein
MREQELDDGLTGLVPGRIEAQCVEALVASDQVGGRAAQQVEEALVGGAVRGLLEVFDDVELDAALAQDLDRAARLASAGVVIDEHDVHRGRL